MTRNKSNFHKITLFYNHLVEVDDPEIIRVTRIKQDTFNPPVLSGSYSDVYAVEVVCIREGHTSFTFMIGNTPSSTNEYELMTKNVDDSYINYIFLSRHPIQSAKEVYIHCDLPTKIVVKAEPRKMDLDTIQYVANPKTSRVIRLLKFNSNKILITLIFRLWFIIIMISCSRSTSKTKRASLSTTFPVLNLTSRYVII